LKNGNSDPNITQNNNNTTTNSTQPGNNTTNSPAMNNITVKGGKVGGGKMPPKVGSRLFNSPSFTPNKNKSYHLPPMKYDEG